MEEYEEKLPDFNLNGLYIEKITTIVIFIKKKKKEAEVVLRMKK